MSTELDILQIIYESLGVFGLIGFGGLFLLLFNEGARKSIKDLFSPVRNKPNPEYHFNELIQRQDFILSSDDSILHFNDLGRQRIFRDLVYLHLTLYKEMWIEYNEKYLMMRRGGETEVFFRNQFSRVNREFFRRQIEMGVPEIAIRKYHSWSGMSINYILNSIESVQSQDVYKKPECKAEAIFRLLRSSMELSMHDAERTLNSLNGDLTGLEYKGVVCGPLPRKH